MPPHFSLATCPKPDLLLIPGGYGARRLVKNDLFLAWVQQQVAHNERTLSACTGALVLAQAGLLANLPATTHHSAFDMLAALPLTTTVITDQRFVDDGRVMTSGGVSAGIDLALALVETLLGQDAVATVRKDMEWAWHQP